MPGRQRASETRAVLKPKNPSRDALPTVVTVTSCGLPPNSIVQSTSLLPRGFSAQPTHLGSAPPAQDARPLGAGRDAELPIHVGQMIFHGPRTDEQPRADLEIRGALGRECGNARLLRGQLVGAPVMGDHTLTRRP